MIWDRGGPSRLVLLLVPLLGLFLVLLAPAAASADVVRLLEDPREAFLARAELIASATDEVLLQSFIVGDDRVSLATLALLREAARRGVDVKLLVDWQWSEIPRTVKAHLMAEGVEIREYHPFRADRLHWFTRRMHDKVLVVDARHVVVGGRNVEAPYFGDGDQVGRRDYVDCDLAAETPEASCARDHFLALWHGGRVQRARHPRFPEDRARAAVQLDEAARWLEERLAAWGADPSLVPGPAIEVGGMLFLHDAGGRKRAFAGVGAALVGLIDGAHESVVAETPYLVPTRRLRRALAGAVSRGVDVRILTNSLASTDNLWAQAAYAGERRPLARSGVRLFEYAGPESLHAKTVVVDRRTCLVGSFNFDPRSEKLNTEVALVVEDEELARELLASMDSHLAGTWEIGGDGRPLGASTLHPGVSRRKVLRMQLRRLLVPLLRDQI